MAFDQQETTQVVMEARIEEDWLCANGGSKHEDCNVLSIEDRFGDRRSLPRTIQSTKKWIGYNAWMPKGLTKRRNVGRSEDEEEDDPCVGFEVNKDQLCADE